ncbi:MAG: acyl-CoA synthetase (AMP-forming)/AMP-acid ligase II [Bacteroidia bacterium]|jgi:acyl-CoA synthetase (AMP-forming)/AMP-acid ligase II
MISMPTMIERAARLNPHGICTRFEGREFNWAQTRDQVARLASALATFGLNEGDRVGILSLNSDRYYQSVFAIGWARYAMVPLNTRWALPENNYAVTDSGLRVLLFDDAFTDQAEQLLQEIETLSAAIYMGDGTCPAWAASYAALVTDSEPALLPDIDSNTMAGIFYTGGTTGFPKGVMQSHRAIWASAMGALPVFGMDRRTIYLHAAPMFHMADFAGSMGATISCGANVILRAFDPEQVLDIFGAEKVTHALLVPAMIKMMLNHPALASADVSSLKCLAYGASPMPAATLETFMQQWPTVGLVQAYGQTELAPIVTMLPQEDHQSGSEKLKSAGLPTAVSELRIVDEQGADCAQGISGEVVVRGPHGMIGYWNKPEETARALQDGWIFTGDAGYLDADGYLFIVDRVKDMVVTGGENVFTTEVENALISHAAVQDVAVIGIPDEEWGEAVHAIVILHAGQSVDTQALLDHCRERIAGYKLPKGITVREEPLPLSGAGKVLKTELRKPYWEGRDRQVS